MSFKVIVSGSVFLQSFNSTHLLESRLAKEPGFDSVLPESKSDFPWIRCIVLA